jgi:hypothetical protein
VILFFLGNLLILVSFFWEGVRGRYWGEFCVVGNVPDIVILG